MKSAKMAIAFLNVRILVRIRHFVWFCILSSSQRGLQKPVFSHLSTRFLFLFDFIYLFHWLASYFSGFCRLLWMNATHPGMFTCPPFNFFSLWKWYAQLFTCLRFIFQFWLVKDKSNGWKDNTRNCLLTVASDQWESKLKLTRERNLNTIYLNKTFATRDTL